MGKIFLTIIYFCSAIFGYISCVTLENPSVTSNQSENEKNPLIWKLSDKDSAVYIFGSMHFIRPEAYPLPDYVIHHFDESKILVFEIDLGTAKDPSIIKNAVVQNALLEPQVKLSQLLTKMGKQELIPKIEAKTGVKIEASSLNFYRPWFVSINLMQPILKELGFDGTGIDQFFYDRGMNRSGAKPKVVGLETLAEQFSFFGGLSPDQDIQFLEDSLKYEDENKELVEKIYLNWIKGREVELGQLLDKLQTSDDDVMDLILYQRNRNWVPKILKILSGSEDAFVVVGAGHLVGQNNLIELIREKGQSVTLLRK